MFSKKTACMKRDLQAHTGSDSSSLTLLRKIPVPCTVFIYIYIYIIFFMLWESVFMPKLNF